MIVALIVGDRMQNIIPSFWSTFLFSGPPSSFLDHLSGPPSGVLPDLQSGIKNVRPFRALRICNPPLLDAQKGFVILLAADCKSAGLKEVGAFLDDGLQISRNERWLALYFTKTLPLLSNLSVPCPFHRVPLPGR